MLTPNELIRYDRQLKIPELGEAGQIKLKNSHAVIIGIGGLGCASATYLTAAGVGRITLVDFDVVERSNLNRQVLYWEEDIGKKKVIVAQRKLSKLNPGSEIVPVFDKITEENALRLIGEPHVVLDGLDNVASRLIVNAACVKRKVPYIHGGVGRLRGLVTTIIPGETPCLACIYPERAEQRGGSGVLGSVIAVVANVQVLEAIKLILGQRSSLAGKLLRFNGNDMTFRVNEIRRNKSCMICGSLRP
jgi:molybdopterin/thiamine biosynthesis adenylyltransferase